VGDWDARTLNEMVPVPVKEGALLWLEDGVPDCEGETGRDALLVGVWDTGALAVGEMGAVEEALTVRLT
jgi:hypothetical protein